MAENKNLCHDLITASFHYVKQVMDVEQMSALCLLFLSCYWKKLPWRN